MSFFSIGTNLMLNRDVSQFLSVLAKLTKCCFFKSCKKKDNDGNSFFKSNKEAMFSLAAVIVVVFMF